MDDKQFNETSGVVTWNEPVKTFRCNCLKLTGWALAQLVKRSLTNPAVHGSYPGISKIYIEHLFTVNYMKKTKIKKKETEDGHFLKRKRLK